MKGFFFHILLLLIAEHASGDDGFSTNELPRHLHLQHHGIVRAPLKPESIGETDRTRIAFGSCNNHRGVQWAWERIATRKPDVFVWLGDIVYADMPVFLKFRIPATSERLAAHYQGQLAVPEYREFMKRVPVLGVNDDHDMGCNDGDKTFNATARSLSRLLLWDFLAEPLDSPRRLHRTFSGGVWRLGRSPRSVRIILLDNRHSKDPYGHSLEQDMLGPEQWRWLEHELRSKTAELTIIGAGLQVRGEEIAVSKHS
jgi:alkaline phosphatase D